MHRATHDLASSYPVALSAACFAYPNVACKAPLEVVAE